MKYLKLDDLKLKSEYFEAFNKNKRSMYGFTSVKYKFNHECEKVEKYSKTRNLSINQNVIIFLIIVLTIYLILSILWPEMFLII